jgi:hypothetical protein
LVPPKIRSPSPVFLILPPTPVIFPDRVEALVEIFKTAAVTLALATETAFETFIPGLKSIPAVL